jgi:hypothetical protein
MFRDIAEPTDEGVEKSGGQDAGRSEPIPGGVSGVAEERFAVKGASGNEF